MPNTNPATSTARYERVKKMLNQSNFFSNFKYSNLSACAMLVQWCNLIFNHKLKSSNPVTATVTGIDKMAQKCVVESIEYFFPIQIRLTIDKRLISSFIFGI
jgi:hypothetical protein